MARTNGRPLKLTSRLTPTPNSPTESVPTVRKNFTPSTSHASGRRLKPREVSDEQHGQRDYRGGRGPRGPGFEATAGADGIFGGGPGVWRARGRREGPRGGARSGPDGHQSGGGSRRHRGGRNHPGETPCPRGVSHGALRSGHSRARQGHGAPWICPEAV